MLRTLACDLYLRFALMVGNLARGLLACLAKGCSWRRAWKTAAASLRWVDNSNTSLESYLRNCIYRCIGSTRAVSERLIDWSSAGQLNAVRRGFSNDDGETVRQCLIVDHMLTAEVWHRMREDELTDGQMKSLWNFRSKTEYLTDVIAETINKIMATVSGPCHRGAVLNEVYDQLAKGVPASFNATRNDNRTDPPRKRRVLEWFASITGSQHRWAVRQRVARAAHAASRALCLSQSATTMSGRTPRTREAGLHNTKSTVSHRNGDCAECTPRKGLKVLKYFETGTPYVGCIVREPDPRAARSYFHIKYDDGDSEDMDIDEVRDVVTAHRKQARFRFHAHIHVTPAITSSYLNSRVYCHFDGVMVQGIVKSYADTSDPTSDFIVKFANGKTRNATLDFVCTRQLDVHQLHSIIAGCGTRLVARKTCMRRRITPSHNAMPQAPPQKRMKLVRQQRAAKPSVSGQ